MSESSPTNDRMTAHAGPDAAELCWPIVELRQYTLKPGRRDDLINLFEEHFVEGQEEYGMQIVGQFRHCSNPDLFVWIRAFPDMEARHAALAGFYGGPIWKQYGPSANDTMIDSDNVLLLKPTHSRAGFRYDPARRPARDAAEAAGGVFLATVYSLAAPPNIAFVDFFEASIVPTLRRAGATVEGLFVTEPSENTFKILPVREGEHVVVWFASFADDAAYVAYESALAQDERWNSELAPALAAWLSQPEEQMKLIPSRRSQLRHRSAQK